MVTPLPNIDVVGSVVFPSRLIVRCTRPDGGQLNVQGMHNSFKETLNFTLLQGARTEGAVEIAMISDNG